MTTIAFDGILLAADSQLTGNYILPAGVKKIHRFAGGWYVAGAGDYGQVVQAVSALSECNSWPNTMRCVNWPETLDNCEVLAVSVKGDIFLFTDDCGGKAVRVIAPIAIGSGDCFAITALILGKNAREAVEIAALLDESTGGDIVAIVVATGVIT